MSKYIPICTLVCGRQVSRPEAATVKAGLFPCLRYMAKKTTADADGVQLVGSNQSDWQKTYGKVINFIRATFT